MPLNNRFALTVITLVLTLNACTSKSPKCPIQSLLLDENLFPPRTHAEQLFSPVPERPRESAGQQHSYTTDLVLQEVINWHSERSAKNEFDVNSKSVFDVDQFMGPWETPPGMYISEAAKNYLVACGMAGHIYQCRMLATYSGYSVFFRAFVSEQGITIQKINELLQAIDKRMIQCTS